MRSPRQHNKAVHTILIDSNEQTNLDRDGFVVLRPDWGTVFDKIAEETIWLTSSLNGAAHFHSIDVLETDDSLKFSDKVFALLRESLATLLQNYSPFLAFASVKPHGKGTGFPVHQDWCFVDEDSYRSYNLFIPLQDTNVSNGCLHFLSGSHEFARFIRAAPNSPSALDGLEEEIRARLTPVPTKAGEIVLFHHSSVHCSSENLSGQRRVAILAGILDPDADLLHHYCRRQEDGSHRISRFRVTAKDYLKCKGLWLPDLQPTDTFTYNFPKLCAEDLITAIG
jgi:hypothetical protein